MASILLVEDDLAAGEWIRRCLSALSEAHRLVVSTTASEALSLSQKERFDLFLLDIQLPDYRGTELGRQLRAIPAYQFTPILFTTQLSDEELTAYREIKCYDFLVKPFTQEQFSRSVTNALELGARMVPPAPVLRIQQKSFLFEYDLRDLLYVESFGKRLVIHSCSADSDLSDEISGYSLARILELAGPGQLLQCHKSYLINPAQLARVDRTAKVLYLRRSDVPIPIGEKYRQNLRRWGL